MNNLMPKATSAVYAADHVFENLSKKILSFSYRIPTSIVSSATLILNLEQKLKHDDLISSFYEFEKNQTHKIIKNSTLPLVSLDYAKDDHSVIIDHRWTTIDDFNLLKLVYWYDNEWGYSNRVVDLVKLVSSSYK
jgi:glyceraldehyde 3-phosphate dehydrogenase